MWKIKYFNDEPIEFDKDNKPIENIVNLEYPVYTEEDKTKWFDIINKTYSKYGEVTVAECEDDRPKSELEELKNIVNMLTLENLKAKGVIQ